MSRDRLVQIFLTVVFLGLLALPVWLTHQPSAVDQSPAGGSHGALSRYGFRFEEVSKAAGIDFVHQAPVLDAKLQRIMPEVSSMGAAVSICDFDHDGWSDIYVTNSAVGSQNHLYRNMHDGTFKDVAAQMGVADLNKPGTGVCMGAVWGDYDNDGYEDLLVYKWGKPLLFHNDHGRGFTDVSDKAGLPKWMNCNSAIWFDYNRDGHLDLFLGGYYREDLDLWHLKNTKMMPDSFEYAENGGRKFLLRNNGNGTFTDVTEQVGLDSHRWALAAAAADLRGTGYPDLVIANDYGNSEFFANEGGKRFKEIGKQVGIAVRPKSGMNVAFGDIFNQGRPAIYISNISEEGILIQGNNLWVPQAGTSGDSLHYDNMAEAMGAELGGWSFGAQFGDLNNSGYLDLFLANGYISADRNKSYWYDFAKVAGGNSSIISDAANWPPFNGASLSGYQHKRVWLNDGAGKFVDVAPMVGVTQTCDGRSVALGDLWNRGVLDVVMASQKGPLLLFKNHVDPKNHWIEFGLQGTRSNRSAIGAGVTLYWNGQEQLQFVCGGSGFSAENQRRLHFGLGKAPHIEKAVIKWPSGKVQTVTALSPDHLYPIVEPS